MTVPNFLKSMKILSIQSHVVHGYVGNRAATFPLQLRGFDVDVLNTVQFSNHPAYGSFKGTRSTVEEIKDVYLGLCEIGCEYDAVLTGYVPNDDSLKTVNEICSEICSKNKNTKWFLDPVLGDNGRLYVSEGNVQTYKDILHNGLITLVTPNQLELEVLSGKKVTDLESLKVVVDTFNETYNIPNLVVTSVKLDNEPNHFYSIGSVRATDGTYKTFYFKVPVIQAGFSGSGDLFSGLLAANYFKYSERYPEPVNDSTSIEAIPLFHSLNEVISIVDKVLQITYDYEVSKYKGLEIPSNLKINDLRIIQAQKYYLEDMANFKGTLL